MAKKCLFSKATEELNTSVTVQCSLGPITVAICDDELGRSLAEVRDAVVKLVTQAEELAETFGFDLEEAIAKGGMMTIGGPTDNGPIPAAQPVPAAPVASPGPVTMRMQQIPSRNGEDEEDQEEASEGASEGAPVQAVAVSTPAPARTPIVESVKPGEKVQVKQRVQSPTGRQFELPERTVDETGETIIAIDTNSEKAFNDNWERMKRDGKNNGAVDQSFGDGYSVQFNPCKLCMKNGTPTGQVSGQKCPKCNGAGEVTVRR